jgi:hypothetical protein
MSEPSYDRPRIEPYAWDPLGADAPPDPHDIDYQTADDYRRTRPDIHPG